jgi:hypothetical protein
LREIAPAVVRWCTAIQRPLLRKFFCTLRPTVDGRSATVEFGGRNLIGRRYVALVQSTFPVMPEVLNDTSLGLRVNSALLDPFEYKHTHAFSPIDWALVARGSNRDGVSIQLIESDLIGPGSRAVLRNVEVMGAGAIHRDGHPPNWVRQDHGTLGRTEQPSVTALRQGTTPGEKS